MRLVNSISKGKRRVYDIEVDEVHNFYANGLNVHNCATDGGVSVIKDDGSVVDLTSTVYLDYGLVAFTDTGGLIAVNRLLSGSYVYIHGWDSIPNADRINSVDSIITSAAIPTYLRNTGYVVDNTDNAFATDGGLTLLERHPTVAQSSVAYITSDYNSGYMTGDIKGAWLSDTDTTNVVGTELVTNGTFDTDTTGWTAETGGSSIAWNASGYIDVTRLNSPTAGVFTVQQAITGLVVGRVYYITGTIITASVQASILVGDDNTGTPIYTDSHILYSNNAETNGFGTFPAEAKLVFRATATTMYIGLGARSDATGTATFDNISVRLADADRSVNNNGLQVNGTITKTAVA